MFSVGATLTMWLDLNQYVTQNDSVLKAWYYRLLLLLVAIVFGLTIGYSRILLGVHSWNQVVFGWSLGIWIAFTLHFCVKEQIVENAWNLLSGEETRFATMTIRCLVLLSGIMFVSIFDFWIIDSMIVSEKSWTDNITEKCGEQKSESSF